MAVWQDLQVLAARVQSRGPVRVAAVDPAAPACVAMDWRRFQALSGDRAGEYSIRLNRQWRICFRWGDEGPYDVEIVDYHR